MTSFPPIHPTPGSFLESSINPQQSPTTQTDSLYKGKEIPVQAWTGPEGSRRLRLPEFHDKRKRWLVMSALCTGRLYPQGNILGTHF